MGILNFYLTSLEPDIAQTNYAQSIGGFCSISKVYPETTLLSTIGTNDLVIALNTPQSGGWGDWSGSEYISIGRELIQVEPIENGSLTVVQRGVNDYYNMHLAGDVVKASSSKRIFNDVFNNSNKQYRCFALRNDSYDINPSDPKSAYDFSVFIESNSRGNSSNIKIGLEYPYSQYISGTSSEWGTDYLIDSSLSGMYPQDHFKDAYLKILSGEAINQGRLIKSYNDISGEFQFYSSFSSTYSFSNADYEVLPSPSQRIKSGLAEPVLTGSKCFSFFKYNENNAIRYFDIDSSSVSVGDISPNNAVYIWVEREVDRGHDVFYNNDIVLGVKYRLV